MKQLKKLITLFSVALFCLVPVFGSVMTVEASTPTTWYLSYVESISEWRFQKGTWKDDGYHRELYYMYQDIKDGDIVVVGGTGDITLDIPVTLSNLTILNPGTSLITAKSIDQLYAGGDCQAAINCDVKEAYIYDQCSVNLNNNADYVEVICKQGPKANVAVLGNTNHLKGWDGTKTYYEAYNFKTGKLYVAAGTLKTDAADYSTIPSSAPAPSAPVVNTPSADEYDAVPKTGDFYFSPVWLLALSAICLLGSYSLKRR